MPDDSPNESDARFPSGEWTGFFLQPRYYSGRVKMSLTLTYKDGSLKGEGVDCVGDFVMRGTYDLASGEVIIHKRYLRANDVYYRGFAEPKHKGIWGVWQIRSDDRGGWHIWPKSQGTHVDLAEGEQADVPAQVADIEDELLPVEVSDVKPR